MDSSDMSARLAAIKDIPTQRLIEVAVAEAAGLISILPSAAERARQDAQPNEPLTLEELRGIDGVVWVCYPQATFGTRLPPTDQLTCTRYKFSFSDYGKTWLAYRRPPKEA